MHESSGLDSCLDQNGALDTGYLLLPQMVRTGVTGCVASTQETDNACKGNAVMISLTCMAQEVDTGKKTRGSSWHACMWSY